MKNLKYIISTVLLSLTVIIAYSQEVTVSGKVTDGSNGEGLPGVNIVVKGTTNGTVTDFDGNYKVAVGSDAILVFSFVGYTNVEETVGNRTVVDVSMELDITQLSEVIVVGYGEQESKDVTGVVAAVNSEDFNKGAIVSPGDLIAGKIAGVQVSTPSGEPGQGPTIRIRGTASVNAASDPLYVIDGVPVDNAGVAGGRSPLNFLNASDIESFTVLKDASAAAIYGSRGTNGVILITTKKGATGKPSINYNGWYSVSDAIETVEVLNGNEYRDAVAAIAPGKSELLLNANTDWQAKVLRQAVGQNHEISIAGGNKDMGYRVSLGRLEQEGIVKKSQTEKTTVGINLNGSAVDDHLKFNLSFKGARTEDNFQDGGVIGSAIGYAPSQPVYDVNNDELGGYWEWPLTFGQAVATNPISSLNQTIDVGEIFRGLTNLKIDYDVHYVEGLTATLILGYDLMKAEQNRFNPSTLRSQQSTNGTIFNQITTRTNELYDFYLNYKRDVASINSSFDFTVGYEFQDRLSTFPQVTGTQLSTDGFGLQSLGAASEFAYKPGVVPQRIRSYFGRLNYEFNDKYLLTLTLRNDGSSQFGKENQRGWFPALGLAWRVSDEDFLSSVDVISNLKLRVGYGVLGNQDFSPFQYVTTYTPGDVFSRYVIDGVPVTTLRPSARNEEIKWEETKQLNIGVDFGVLDGRLTGSIDYYNKQTSDLIFLVPVPSGTNLSNFVTTNIGAVENKGVELTLNATAIDKADLRWDLSYNIATNKNKIKTLDGTGSDVLIGGISGGVGSTIQVHRVGEPLFSYYTMTHLFDGNGKRRVDNIDYNGDGTINDADIYADNNGDGDVNLDDRVISGSPFPDFTMGLTSNLTYKRFDLAFTFRASVGNDVYNNVASSNGNYSKIISDIVPGNMHSSVLKYQFVEPQILSDTYVTDGSFLRMDNISLGYQVPKLPNNMRMRVYGTIQNAFLITGYEGLDPELGATGIDNAPGIDNNVYPRSRTFIVGVSLGL